VQCWGHVVVPPDISHILFADSIGTVTVREASFSFLYFHRTKKSGSHLSYNHNLFFRNIYVYLPENIFLKVNLKKVNSEKINYGKVNYFLMFDNVMENK